MSSQIFMPHHRLVLRVPGEFDFRVPSQELLQAVDRIGSDGFGMPYDYKALPALGLVFPVRAFQPSRLWPVDRYRTCGSRHELSREIAFPQADRITVSPWPMTSAAGNLADCHLPVDPRRNAHRRDRYFQKVSLARFQQRIGLE